MADAALCRLLRQGSRGGTESALLSMMARRGYHLQNPGYNPGIKNLIFQNFMKDMTMLNSKSLGVICLLALLLAPGLASAQRTYINPSLAGGSGAPFSGAVLTGDTLYLSGMLGLEGGQVPDDPAQEARNVLNAIRATLQQADMTMDDLVYVQIFCSDVAHYDAFNAVYRSYFTQEFPARAFVGSGTLLFNARFEVQAIAVRR
jgi:enamine deaminase RidA (YjgF/YER057c/UK114 family)